MQKIMALIGKSKSKQLKLLTPEKVASRDLDSRGMLGHFIYF